MRRVGVCVAVCAAFAVSSSASARVLRVGSFHGISGQFASIQAAVDAARPGDWILIGPGDYKTLTSRHPAGAKDVAVPAEITAGQPIRIWGLFPHTHLRGTRWRYTLVRPDSTSEVILDMPHYDFNWQTYYMFAKPLEIPAGGKLMSMAWYDNSATNKHNPDPAVDVHWGPQTWEEMQYTGFLYSVIGNHP